MNKCKSNEFTIWEELFKYLLLIKYRIIVMSEIASAIVVVIAKLVIAVIIYFKLYIS